MLHAMATDRWLAADWPAPPGVVAGVSLRTGGISVPPWDSCNVGVTVGDDAAAVAANRKSLVESIAACGDPLWLRQVHGADVVDADRFAAEALPTADAAVTRRGRCLMIQTADCLPVVVAKADGSVLGAAHAGWRGLASGVLEALMAELNDPQARWQAWLGPSISAVNYEIDDPVRDAFVAREPTLAQHFSATRPGHYTCDLAGIATTILLATGVNSIYRSAACTYADAERFFSYRRDGQSGRQATFIGRVR